MESHSAYVVGNKKLLSSLGVGIHACEKIDRERARVTESETK